MPGVPLLQRPGIIAMTKPSSSPKSTGRTAVVESSADVWNSDERDLARLEPAWAKASLFFRTGHRFGHPSGSIRCMSLDEVYRILEVYRSRFMSGETLSLLAAVGICSEENLPLPTWLADAFRSRMTEFLTPGKLRSLDEVFSSGTLPTSSAKKAAAARQDWQLAVCLCQDAWRMAQDDETLASFDRVVERLLKTRDYGVRKTKAKQLISMLETSQS